MCLFPRERVRKVVKFLRLRPEAERAELIRVYNDTVEKLSAQILWFEKENKALKDGIEELRSSVEALQAASTTEEEV